MIILEGIRVILGILLTLFIPGFLLNLILFKKQDWIERIVIGIIFSIIIDVSLAFFLGANEFLKNLTGGITTFNIYIYLILISVIESIIWLYNKNLKGIKMIRLKDLEKSLNIIHIRVIFIQLFLLMSLIIYLIEKPKETLPLWIFWIIILVQVITSFEVILRFPKNYKITSLIILSISITSVYVWGLPAQYQMDGDTYFESQYSSIISKEGFWNPHLGESIAKNYYGYNPLIHFVLSFLSLTTGLSTYLISKYLFIFVIKLLVILLFLILTRSILKEHNEKILPYIATLVYILSHGVISIFVSRRYMSVIFIFFSLYCLFSLKNEYYSKILFPISSFLVILGDHSNTYLYLFILLSIWTFSIAINYKRSKKGLDNANILSSNQLVLAFAIIITWIIFVGNIFLSTDTRYVSDIYDFVSKKGINSISETIEFGLNSITKFSSSIVRMFSSQDLREFEMISNNSLNETLVRELSQTNKTFKEILSMGASKSNINFFYENTLAYTAQLIFICLSILGVFYFLKEYKKNKRGYNENNFLILFGILGLVSYLVLGFLIRTPLNTFTSTYFWFSSFPLAVFISFSFIVLQNKKLKMLSVILITLISIGNLIIDYSPLLINREGGEGIWIDHSKSKTDELFYSAVWMNNHINKNSTIISDVSFRHIISGYFQFDEVFISYYTRLFYTNPKFAIKLLKEIPNKRKYIQYNSLMFVYPNNIFKVSILSKDYYKNDMNIDVVYNNGQILTLKIN